MYKKKNNSVSVKKIAEFLESDYNNEDFEIDTISSLNNVKDHSILFYTDIINFKFKLKDNTEYDLNQLEKFKNISKKLKSKFVYDYNHVNLRS